MKTYSVNQTVEVQAESREEAKRKAKPVDGEVLEVHLIIDWWG